MNISWERELETVRDLEQRVRWVGEKKAVDFFWFWRKDQKLEARHSSAWNEFYRYCYCISHLLLFSCPPLLISWCCLMPWCTHQKSHIIMLIDSWLWIGCCFTFLFLLSISLGLNLNVDPCFLFDVW